MLVLRRIFRIGPAEVHNPAHICSEEPNTTDGRRTPCGISSADFQFDKDTPYLVSGVRQRYFPREIELAVLTYIEYNIRKDHNCMFQFLRNYKGNEMEKKRLEALCDFLYENDWRLLETFESTKLYATKAHCASAFYNIRSKQLVITHRGSQNLESFKADYTQVFWNRRSTFAEMACEFTYQMVRKFGSVSRSITVTGHSLGGWLAQVAICSMKFPNKDHKLFDIDINKYLGLSFSPELDEYVEDSYHLHCVAFDSPGSSEIIDKDFNENARNLNVNVYPLHRLANAKSLNSLDITVYLTLPNFANVMKEQKGDIYRMKSKLFEGPSSLAIRLGSWRSWLAWTFENGYVQVTSHFMSGIVDFWVNHDRLHNDSRLTRSLQEYVKEADAELHLVEMWRKVEREDVWLRFVTIPRFSFYSDLKSKKADLLQFRISVFHDEKKELGHLGRLAKTIRLYKEDLRQSGMVENVDFLTDSFDYVEGSEGEVIGIKKYEEQRKKDGDFNEIGSSDLKDEFVEMIKFRLKEVANIPDNQEACYIAKSKQYIEGLPKLKDVQLPESKFPSGRVTIFSVEKGATMIFTSKVYKYFQSLFIDPRKYLCVSTEDLVELNNRIPSSEFIVKLKWVLIEYVEGCDTGIVTNWMKRLVRATSVKKLVLIQEKGSVSPLEVLNIYPTVHNISWEEVQLKFGNLESKFQKTIPDMFLKFKGEPMRLRNLLPDDKSIWDPLDCSEILPYLSVSKDKLGLNIGSPTPTLLEHEYFQPRDFKQRIVTGCEDDCETIVIRCSGLANECDLKELFRNFKVGTGSVNLQDVCKVDDEWSFHVQCPKFILIGNDAFRELSSVYGRNEMFQILSAKCRFDIHKFHLLKQVGKLLVWQDSFGINNFHKLKMVKMKFRVVNGCKAQAGIIVIRCSGRASEFNLGGFLVDGQSIDESDVYNWDQGDFKFSPDHQRVILIGKAMHEKLCKVMGLFREKLIETFHLLREESNMLFWEESNGRAGLLTFLKDSNINFENFLQEIQAPLVIIADEPGMGKSVIMKSFAAKSHKGDAWTILIDLQRTALSLEQFRFTEASEHLQNVAEWLCHQDGIGLKFISDCFLACLKMNDKVRIFFDGFDEISDNLQKKVSSMVDDLLNEGSAHIVIATRRHKEEFLEKKFNRLSYCLEPFEERESIKFLNDFFKSHQKYKDEFVGEPKVQPSNDQIQIYLDKLFDKFAKQIGPESNEYIGRPLQMYMLGVICTDGFFQYCKDCVRNETSGAGGLPQFIFPEFTDVCSLYTAFINEKFRIALIDKGQLTRNCDKSVYTFNKKELLRVYGICGFEFIFGIKNREKYFRPGTRQKVKDVQWLLLGGIVQCVNEDALVERPSEVGGKAMLSIHRFENNITFIHRTLAEYFAARFLFKEFCPLKKTLDGMGMKKLLPKGILELHSVKIDDVFPDRLSEEEKVFKEEISEPNRDISDDATSEITREVVTEKTTEPDMKVSSEGSPHLTDGSKEWSFELSDSSEEWLSELSDSSDGSSDGSEGGSPELAAYHKILDFMKGNLFLDKNEKFRFFVDSFLLNKKDTNEIFKQIPHLNDEKIMKDARAKVETYLKSRESPCDVDCFDRTILHYAFQSCDLCNIKWLLADATYLMDNTDVFGATPFAYVKDHFKGLFFANNARNEIKKDKVHTWKLGEMSVNVYPGRLVTKEWLICFIFSGFGSLFDSKPYEEVEEERTQRIITYLQKSPNLLDLTIHVLGKRYRSVLYVLDIDWFSKVTLTSFEWLLRQPVTRGQLLADFAIAMLRCEDFADVDDAAQQKVFSNSLDLMLKHWKNVFNKIDEFLYYDLHYLSLTIGGLQMESLFEQLKKMGLVVSGGRDRFVTAYKEFEKSRNEFFFNSEEFLSDSSRDIGDGKGSIRRSVLVVWKYFVPVEQNRDILVTYAKLFEKVLSDKENVLYKMHLRGIYKDLSREWERVTCGEGDFEQEVFQKWRNSVRNILERPPAAASRDSKDAGELFGG